MSNTFQLEIITPTKIISVGQVSYVRAASSDGLFGIMAGHTTATIALNTGEIKVQQEGKDTYYATNGGYADIQPESVLLLVETAEEVTDIDIKRAEDALERAQDRIKEKEVNLERAKSAIIRARNRLKLTSRI